jgi:acyl carrier protein
VSSAHRTVEDTIRTHPDVAEVAIVHAGGALTAVVVPVTIASAPEIRDHVWAVLGDERSPRTVALLPTLPRDGRGEVDQVELGRVLAEDDPPTSTYVPPRTPLEAAVAGVLAEVLEKARVGVDDDFLELGGDSLRAIDAVNLLEQRTGLLVPVEELFAAGTVRALAARGDDPAEPDALAGDPLP